MPVNRFAKKPLPVQNKSIEQPQQSGLGIVNAAAIMSAIASAGYLGLGGFDDIYKLLTPENASNITKIAMAMTSPVVALAAVAVSGILGAGTTAAAIKSFERAKEYIKQRASARTATNEEGVEAEVAPISPYKTLEALIKKDGDADISSIKEVLAKLPKSKTTQDFKELINEAAEKQDPALCILLINNCDIAISELSTKTQKYLDSIITDLYTKIEANSDLFKCPISKELIDNPISIKSRNGIINNFEHESIANYTRNNSANPLTNEAITENDITTPDKAYYQQLECICAMAENANAFMTKVANHNLENAKKLFQALTSSEALQEDEIKNIREMLNTKDLAQEQGRDEARAASTHSPSNPNAEALQTPTEKQKTA